MFGRKPEPPPRSILARLERAGVHVHEQGERPAPPSWFAGAAGIFCSDCETRGLTPFACETCPGPGRTLVAAKTKRTFRLPWRNR